MQIKNWHRTLHSRVATQTNWRTFIQWDHRNWQKGRKELKAKAEEIQRLLHTDSKPSLPPMENELVSFAIIPPPDKFKDDLKQETESQGAQMADINFVTVLPQGENVSTKKMAVVFREPRVAHSAVQLETTQERFERDDQRLHTVGSLKCQTASVSAPRECEEDYWELTNSSLKCQTASVSAPRECEEESIPITRMDDYCELINQKPWSVFEVTPNMSREHVSRVETSDTHIISHETNSADAVDTNDINVKFSQNAIQFSTTSSSLLIEGSVSDRKLLFLIDTGANVSAIGAEVWRQLPLPTKHPPGSTKIHTIRAVNGQEIPVLRQAQLAIELDSKIYNPGQFIWYTLKICSVLVITLVQWWKRLFFQTLALPPSP